VALRLTEQWATYWFVFFDEEPRFDTMTAAMSQPAVGFNKDDKARAPSTSACGACKNGFTAFPREAANDLARRGSSTTR